jgi:hypothetical protein
VLPGDYLNVYQITQVTFKPAAVLNQTDTESRQSLWIALVWWKKALERF